MEIFRRRKEERKEARNLLDYVVAGEDGAPLLRGLGRTRNISGAGLLLETHVPLEPGQRLRLTLGLREETVEVEGRVVRVEPYDEEWFWSGVQFLELDAAGRHVLERYLAAVARSN